MEDEGDEQFGVGFIGANNNQEEAGMQRQSFLAQLFMFIVVITMPFLSPIYLIMLLFYQFCLVEHLSVGSKAVTFIVGVFLSVAWIPYANLFIYVLGDVKDCTNNTVNAFLPLGLFYSFCLWGVLSGIKHFSIADSYEDEQDRSHLRHLKRVELVPPLKLGLDPGVRKRGGVLEPSSSYSHTRGKFNNNVNNINVGEGEAGNYTSNSNTYGYDDEIVTAFDLYWCLKGAKAPYQWQAFLLACLMTIAVVAPSRSFSMNGPSGDAIIISNSSANCSFFDETTGQEYLNQNSTLYILSTIQFCGIFWVFFCVLGTVVVQFLHEIRLLKNLRHCLPDIDQYQKEGNYTETVGTPTFPNWSINGNLNGFRLRPTNISHIRAWDEVRRAGIKELTSSNSVFNSIFSPTVLIMTLGAFGCYTYVVVRLLFQGKQFGFFTAPLAIFAGIMFLFLFVTFLLARSAGSSMKSHRTVISKISFDVSRELDRQLIQKFEENQITTRLPEVTEDLLASLISMRTYLIGNVPRVKLLGFEDRYVRYALVFFLLANGNVMFFALMIAIRDGNCTADPRALGLQGSGGESSSAGSSNHMVGSY